MAEWGYNRDGVILFQFQFLTEVVLLFSSSEVIFKSGVAFKRIRYVNYNLSIGLSRTEVGMYQRQNYTSYQLLLPQCTNTRVGTGSDITTTIRWSQTMKTKAMLCYAALVLPPQLSPPPYYAIVYLCRKDLIKGEKEVPYLFHSTLIKVHAPVHTIPTTTLH